MSEPTSPAGATPAAGGATPPQTPPAASAPAPTPQAQPAPTPAPEPSAPDDTLGLGDAGKRALDAMKAERNAAIAASKAAERELEQLRTAIAVRVREGDRRRAQGRRRRGHRTAPRPGPPGRSEARPRARGRRALAHRGPRQRRGVRRPQGRRHRPGHGPRRRAQGAQGRGCPTRTGRRPTPGPGSVDGGPRAPGAPRATDLATAVAARLGSRTG